MLLGERKILRLLSSTPEHVRVTNNQIALGFRIIRDTVHFEYVSTTSAEQASMMEKEFLFENSKFEVVRGFAGRCHVQHQYPAGHVIEHHLPLLEPPEELRREQEIRVTISFVKILNRS
jgi:hypothetical protein